eukprot:46925-Chlamydomonas_euryale.AAC.3
MNLLQRAGGLRPADTFAAPQPQPWQQQQQQQGDVVEYELSAEAFTPCVAFALGARRMLGWAQRMLGLAAGLWVPALAFKVCGPRVSGPLGFRIQGPLGPRG